MQEKSSASIPPSSLPTRAAQSKRWANFESLLASHAAPSTVVSSNELRPHRLHCPEDGGRGSKGKRAGPAGEASVLWPLQLTAITPPVPTPSPPNRQPYRACSPKQPNHLGRGDGGRAAIQALPPGRPPAAARCCFHWLPRFPRHLQAAAATRKRGWAGGRRGTPTSLARSPSFFPPSRPVQQQQVPAVRAAPTHVVGEW